MAVTHKRHGRRRGLWCVRAAWILAFLSLAGATLFSGCLAPYSAGRDPDHPSGAARARGPFFGELHYVNGTMSVTPVPGLLASAVTPGKPANCFVVDDVEGERASYLGGVLVDLTWTSADPLTEELHIRVNGWSAQGPSPLRLLFNTTETGAIRTPFAVQVAPAGDLPPTAFAPIDVDVRLVTGLLESRFDIGWSPCSVLDGLPVPS